MDLRPFDQARVNRCRCFQPPRIDSMIVKAVGDVGKIDTLFDSPVIRLAPLTPDIARAVLTGEQPTHPTLRELMAPFPVTS